MHWTIPGSIRVNMMATRYTKLKFSGLNCPNKFTLTACKSEFTTDPDFNPGRFHGTLAELRTFMYGLWLPLIGL